MQWNTTSEESFRFKDWAISGLRLKADIFVEKECGKVGGETKKMYGYPFDLKEVSFGEPI